jgi:nucleoside diphosphate kinase
MQEELSYVIVTPYSIRKSRTGGILARLISRTGLDLVAARMFAPSKELTEKYAAMLVTADEPRYRATQKLIQDYVLANFQPTTFRPRVMVLLFKGENAIAKLAQAVGHIRNERTAGETIRDTFGDYVVDSKENVTYFEPAVLIPTDLESCQAHLKLWAEYSDTDGGLLENVVEFAPGANVQKTLVLIKPDNFRYPSSRPGGVMDVFSRTGLSIIGMKVHRMSVAQAEQFYGPVLQALEERKQEPAGKDARALIEKNMEIQLSPEQEAELGKLLGPIVARTAWESILKFMAGSTPTDCPSDQRNSPGSEKCIAIVYQGVDAVRKIREVLGPTDPSKAPTGTIRREFGQSMMINAAHASDSAENAEREMGIVQIRDNHFKELALSGIHNL